MGPVKTQSNTASHAPIKFAISATLATMPTELGALLAQMSILYVWTVRMVSTANSALNSGTKRTGIAFTVLTSLNVLTVKTKTIVLIALMAGTLH